MNRLARGNLDGLLNHLTTKKELTTMAKSRHDWDVSKEEVGDEHELQQFAKDGYVLMPGPAMAYST
jgi:hypothetical protein